VLRRIVLAGSALLFAVGVAGATTLVKMDFPTLVREANYIVVGTVTAIDGDWDEDLNFIHSSVTIAVERSYRGNTPDTLIVRTPGGQVAGVAQHAHGAPSFEIGERVLVFLTSWEDGDGKVLGYEQGKSRVILDDLGRERLKGGSAAGRLLDSVERELREGPRYNLPLKPAGLGGAR
jgi:hypothetical protein